MNKEEMTDKLDAGESPSDISIEKYRELYCKVMLNKPINKADMQSDTCALCKTNSGCCEDCPLTLSGHKCTDDGSAWREIQDLLDNPDHMKQMLLNAIDKMISELKEAKKYEEEDYEPEEEPDTAEYIRKEQACGLKVGDVVKITRKAEYGERGWANSWTKDMKVGYVGKITAICSDNEDNASGIDVRVEEEPSSNYSYPYFVLEKVKSILIVEFKMPDETWEKSGCDEEDMKDLTLVTTTNKYTYYCDSGTILYRVETKED